jgi:dinuclear metal center YbgI/SA1388 family protein
MSTQKQDAFPATVDGLAGAMDRIAPLFGAEPWDRVGLHVGDPARDLAGPVLLTIDLTERVLDEAIGSRASAIVAYHPPIWTPLERVTASTATERIVRGAIEAGIAVYSPHTALDAAAGGVTDWLAECVACKANESADGMTADVRALVPLGIHKPSQRMKLVVFTPRNAVDQIRGALATAGAGQIGGYEVCSFASDGTGTFFGTEGTDPAVGESGRLQEVDEVRLEMVCSRSALPLAIETLRQFHPYEEPAFDVYELQPKPERASGAGRRLVLDQPATIPQIGERLRAHLGVTRIKYALPEGMDEKSKVRRIALVPGSGGELVDTAIAEGCELFVTGEMTHHAVLGATARGLGVLLAGHTNTERGYLPRLAERLRGLMPDASFEISKADADPLVVLQ